MRNAEGFFEKFGEARYLDKLEINDCSLGTRGMQLLWESVAKNKHARVLRLRAAKQVLAATMIGGIKGALASNKALRELRIDGFTFKKKEFA